MTNSLLHCPIPQPLETTPNVLTELAPLIEHLRSNQPITEAIAFPRGTVLPDGRLDLCKQGIGVAGCVLVAEALKRNTTIASLLLGTNGIGNEGARAIAQLIEHCDRLEIVYLGCNAIDQTGIAQLAQVLTQNQSVTGLWLKRNPIGEMGARSLAEMLRNNQSIHTLDLVHTQISKTGFGAILSVLIDSNRTVERLYLGGNQLTVEDAGLIAELLRHNRAIKALLLNVNHLGDQGIEVLANGLQDNQTLIELGLASNGISTIGCQALLPAVQNHPSLEQLDLGYSPSTKVLGAEPNRIGDEGIIAIAHFLTHNQTLLRLDLRGTTITEIARSVLGKALMQNQILCDLRLLQPLDAELTSHLEQNRLHSLYKLRTSREVILIRSVYR
ncbi:hypothetical protein LEP3755_34380 [Leptolyngbya sp. NIES-3755]|nr:hypothetical protein LEP3755_34380 [Leptolyngbya sp. NIES-3755]